MAAQNQQQAPRERYGAETRRMSAIALGILLALALAGIVLGAWRGGLFATLFEGVAEKPGWTGEQEGEQPQEAAPASLEEQVSAKLAEMTLEEKVAQLFIVNPEAIIDIGQATAAGDATKAALTSSPVGGFIYFSGNLIDSEQTRTMLSATQTFANEISGLPMFLCVDEEGGSVSRIGGAEGFGIENVGDMRAIGDAGDVQAAQSAASTVSGYLKGLGFNVNFAPVADIANSESTTMSSRVFGSTADVVSPMVSAQVKGYIDGGILCSAKHFPGIGGAMGDSHEVSIRTDKTLDELRAEELLPFKAAIDAGVPMVMVGHLICEEATGSNLPASVNPVLMTDVLRTEMGYEGIIITDSMSMAAITERLGAQEASLAAFEAGADMILMPVDYQEASRSIVNAVSSGRISQERLDESVARILRAKLSLG